MGRAEGETFLSLLQHFAEKYELKQVQAMKSYQSIVFMQGEESDKVLRLLDGEGIAAAIDYLSQWDMGDGETSDKPSRGTHDNYKQVGDFLLTWNEGLGYIGLERVLESQS